METVINNQIPLDLDEGKRKRGAELLQKTKVKKGNEETEISTRKKPGRKKIEVTESNTKKEKNRVAQRAWRERKEKYVLELEAKINELENAKNKSEKEKQQLKLIIEKLRSENTYLKNATSFIFTPTKETEMFMHQNKLKILHSKKNNKPNTVNNNVTPPPAPPVNPELVNNNVLYESNSNNALSLSGIDENLLAETDPEVLNELYKLINMQNQENSISNPALMTPDSLISSTSSPLVQSMSSSDHSSNMSSNISGTMYNVINPLPNPNDYNTVPNGTTNPNGILLMNDPNSNPAILQQQQLNTINPALINPSTTNPALINPTNTNSALINPTNTNPALINQTNTNPTLINPSTTDVLPNTISQPLPNTIPSTIPNQAIDQNSLLTMSMLNNIPATYSNMQHPTLTQTAAITPQVGIQGMNNHLYQVNVLHPASIPKPYMDYRTDVKVEKSQPITDELFTNMIQMLHQQQQGNIEGDEDDLLIKQINQSAKELYTNPITGMPSPSSTLNYGKDQPSTPDALGTMGVPPYTPEDLDTDSNKSGDANYILPRGLQNFEENVEGPVEIRTREIPMEVLSRELPPEDRDPDDDEEKCSKGNTSIDEAQPMEIQDKRNSSIHSTLQFPAEQKPTKLNIPYSVFPRVTHETVDSFINDAKLSEEELECLCSELKDKATCKEKLKYISKKIDVEGWTIEKWEQGKIYDDEPTECCQSQIKKEGSCMGEQKTSCMSEKPKTSCMSEQRTSCMSEKPRTSCMSEQPRTSCMSEQPRTSCMSEQPKTSCMSEQPKTSCMDEKPKTSCMDEKPVVSCMSENPVRTSCMSEIGTQ